MEASIPAVEAYDAVRAKMEKAALDAARAPDDISLTVVSKTFDVDMIAPILRHGHRVFGENRVREAAAKWPALRERFPDVRLHLIGALQTNKAEDAVRLFDVIEVLDREKLAHALATAMEKTGLRPDCFVQVNTGAEAQKGGIAPKETAAFVGWARRDLNLPIVGLMAIPPVEDAPAPHFALLADLARKTGLARLSMGMSGDFEAAIHLGATDIRVGSAIFGARPKP